MANKYKYQSNIFKSIGSVKFFFKVLAKRLFAETNIWKNIWIMSEQTWTCAKNRIQHWLRTTKKKIPH